MASRALCRRKSLFLDYLNRPSCSVERFSSSGYGQSSQYLNSREFSWVPDNPSKHLNHKCSNAAVLIDKDGLLSLSTTQFFKHNFSGNGKSGTVPSLGIRWMSQSLHSASTAKVGLPENGKGDDGNEKQAAKQKKEASPEECDQAVEGLSAVKAKAKLKQLQASQKSAVSIMQKVWAKLLGIGPALRAIASMSRLELCFFVSVLPNRQFLYVYLFIFLLLGRIGPISFVIGRMSSCRLCSIIGWAQNYSGLMLESARDYF